MKRVLRLVALVVLLLATSALAGTELWSTREGRERVFNALVEVFRDHYWDADYIDWEAWASDHREAALAATSRPAFDNVFRRMVRELADDHSSWLGLPRGSPLEPPVQPPRIGISTDFLPGVGAVVDRVLPDTPAALAGLRRGDVIRSANGRSLLEAGGRGGVQNILAQAIREGRVELEILRHRRLLTVLVEPEEFRLADLESLPQAEMLDPVTGYIYIPTFNRDLVGEQVHRLIRGLQDQGAEALVLDLRGNLGGRLSELGLVLGAFIDGPWTRAFSRGTVIWQSRYEVRQMVGLNLLEDPDGSTLRVDDLENPVHFDGPVAVLVDSRNSSAGEVAALVLKEQGRATVIGEPTSGNVEAVRSFDLPDGSVVLVAVANLEGINGTAFYQGVVPDLLSSVRLDELARGFDAPVSEALRLLRGLPFTPNRFF